MRKRYQFRLLQIAVCCLLSVNRIAVIAQADSNPFEKPIGIAQEGNSIKVFSLVNADAANCVRVLQAIDEESKFSPDPRTNSLVAVSTAEKLKWIEAIVLRLDEAPTQVKSQTTAATPIKSAVVFSLDKGNDGLTANPMRGGDNLNSSEAQILLATLSQKEAKAAALAEQIRTRITEPTVPQSELNQTRKELDASLTDGLAIKFKLEQLQLSALEERIARLKAQMRQRTVSSKQIVERRARELIEGDASQWTPSETEPSPTSAAMSSNSISIKRQATSDKNDQTLPRYPRDIDEVGQTRDHSNLALNEIASARSPFANDQGLISKLLMTDRNVTRAEERVLRMSALAKERAISKEELSKAEIQLEDALLNRKLIQDEYAITMKDLEIQIASTEADLKNIDELSQLAKNGAISDKEFREAKDKTRQGRFELQRLQLRYEFYKKAGEDAKVSAPTNQTGF